MTEPPQQNIPQDRSTPAAHDPGSTTTMTGTRTGAPVRTALAKVPEITAWFWVAKVLTTGMGETASDFLVHQLDPAVALALGGMGLAGALILQFAVRRYVAWVYWLAVVMVSVFGTMAADAVHVVLGVPYVASAVFFLAVLSAVFVIWYRTEGTLSIHSVDTKRREMFYWAAVLTTFALGTATGDMTAYSLDLGYFASGLVFAAVIAVAALAYWRGWVAAIPAFWFAYILTRPLGASFADWTAVSADRGGLGWGTGIVTMGLAVCIAAMVARESVVGRRA
ncbi:hypothetical protein J7I84_11610 [Arthrobacter sp. ISL-85]|uniref:COG4705 family protein n=1 Tax=Arthrobacter sp. ISL-85 TaxID=2819115 RepID=UPI001BE87FE2|nr:hypothetical protein [Arthrobacter sp. ISL-85]MBT2567129.1 hypothetical protein [Arthrobacter sp. ISL-85]